MILHGNQRGGGKDLAIHLMKPENERVQVHEIRGFVSNNLIGAFKESYAISKATRCKQHLYSLSINPPKSADINDADFIAAIDRTEAKLGLGDQPRAVVFHDKRGTDGQLRRHAHAVWCRIDTDRMKAVQLSHTKLKLRDVSRDLHIEHDLKMPPGLINSKDRDPRNFSLEEWQQCKQAKKNVQEIKDTFKDCWAVSDSGALFSHALAERGYILTKGNRGHVAVDYKGEKYAVSRYVGIRAKQVREKLGEVHGFPDVEQVKQVAAKQITDRLKILRAEQEKQAQGKAMYAQKQQQSLIESYAEAARQLKNMQESRRVSEEMTRANRIKKGLMGLFDHLTGKRKQVLAQNATDTKNALYRDVQEAEKLEKRQQKVRDSHQNHAHSARVPHVNAVRELNADIKQISEPPAPSKQKKAEYIAREKQRAKRPRRPRYRNGPNLHP